MCVCVCASHMRSPEIIMCVCEEANLNDGWPIIIAAYILWCCAYSASRACAVKLWLGIKTASALKCKGGAVGMPHRALMCNNYILGS